MAEMVAGIFHMGGWLSLEQVEENLTMRELQLLMNARNEEENKRQKFQAALKGIDLDEGNNKAFENVQEQANAIIAGKKAEDAKQHKEDTFLADIGIDIVTE